MAYLDNRLGQDVPKRRMLGRALGVSRDILHSTRSLYRRERADELVSTIGPLAQAKLPVAHVKEDNGASKIMHSEKRSDMTLQLDGLSLDFPSPVDRREEHSHSIHRTRPLSPEQGSQSGSKAESRSQSQSQRPSTHANPLFSPAPPSLARSKTSFSIPKPSTSYEAPSETRGQPLRLPSRPEIPPRKDSLPLERRVLLDLVDQTTKAGDFRDSTQSVTAYVSAEYSSETLSMTSWLSDPDGPADELASWNRPVASPQMPHVDSVIASARPQMGSRSKTTPVYSTAVAPQEQPNAAYERILREKLRHHAGQVRKRLDTSTYYSPTVRQNEIEVHLAFVRAAEEILKQSPIWHGSLDESTKIKYLLDV